MLYARHSAITRTGWTTNNGPSMEHWSSSLVRSRYEGFIAHFDDGRFIDPFNAMLRAPQLTARLGSWTRASVGAEVPDDMRQVVILTIAAHGRADYEIYAHSRTARVAGMCRCNRCDPRQLSDIDDPRSAYIRATTTN